MGYCMTKPNHRTHSNMMVMEYPLRGRRCLECGRVIPYHEECESNYKIWEIGADAMDVCMDCVAAREALSCGEFEYGWLWEDVFNYLNRHLLKNESKIPWDQFAKLTPRGKEILFKMIETIWNGEYWHLGYLRVDNRGEGLTLSSLLRWLEDHNKNFVVRDGFGEPHPDVKYQDEVSFHPVSRASIGDMIRHVKFAIEMTNEYTHTRIGDYSESGEPITWYNLTYWGSQIDQQKDLLPSNKKTASGSGVLKRIQTYLFGRGVTQ